MHKVGLTLVGIHRACRCLMRHLTSLWWVRIAMEMCLMHQVRIKLTLVIFHEIHLLLLIVVAKSIRLFLINFVSELAVEIRLRLTKIIHMIHLLAKWSL